MLDSSPKDLQDVVNDPAGFCRKRNIRILIVSPSFGTGFSLENWAAVTFAFMFRFPKNTTNPYPKGSITWLAPHAGFI